jgi:molybdopterin molybdotransferase
MVEFKEALTLALQNAQATKKEETVDIGEALNRVSSQDIICKKDLPTYSNSAMDGYAFKYEDINKELKVVKAIYAGDVQEPILKSGECYKIMTGAKVPSDIDTVAPKELCEINEEYIKIDCSIKKGNAIRVKGEEQKKGAILIEKSTLLNPANLALLASQGITELEVYKRLNIAIVSTGNELKEPWQEASEDEVYNINSTLIKKLLKVYNLEAVYLGSIPDVLEKSIEFISKLKDYDVIITTGGISGGDADFTKEAFIQNGLKEIFHGVKVKPGHPTMMGVMDKSFVMAMPGNPLAAIVNIMMLSLPVIFKLQGANRWFYNAITIENGLELKLKPNRVNIVLGNIEDGKFVAYKNNKYGSGMITPLVESRYIALFGEDVSQVREGSKIKIIPLYSALDCKLDDFIN